VEDDRVDPDERGVRKRAANTKAFFAENVGNPAGKRGTSRTVAAIAPEHEAAAERGQHVADAVTCAPDRRGAEIVIQSATRNRLPRHASAASCRSGTFNCPTGGPVSRGRGLHRGLPRLKFHETFGMYGYLMKPGRTLRDLGGALAPLKASCSAGTETCRCGWNATSTPRRWSRVLESTRAGANVTYLACPEAVPAARGEVPACRGAGRCLSFECAGGRAGGQNLNQRRPLWSHLAMSADAKSLIIHPRQHEATASWATTNSVGRRRARDGAGAVSWDRVWSRI